MFSTANTNRRFMAYLNDYSVRVTGGMEDGSGYVLLPHGDTYGLCLRNSHDNRCDARVEIDGKHQGTWRINANGSITIDRPAHDDGLFTFYKANSAEGSQIGLEVGDSNLGLVKVTFTPEKTRSFESGWGGVVQGRAGGASAYSDGSKGLGSRGFSAGGTGLSGQSSQQFGTAAEMDLDYSKSTTIHLRLVVRNNEPRPLTSYSNQVPPPIR